VELFKSPNFDFLGKKWYFIGGSLIFSIAGILSMLFWHGIPLGVDFKGGTLVYVKFNSAPNDDRIRGAMDKAGLHNARIQRYGAPANNEVLIALEEKETSEASLDTAKNQIIQALEANVQQQGAAGNKLDVNNASLGSIREALVAADPLGVGIDAEQRYTEIAQTIVNYRDRTRGGVLSRLRPCRNGSLCRILPSAMWRLWDRRWVRSFRSRPYWPPCTR
jgi:preprotein translocase subunit SecF